MTSLVPPLRRGGGGGGGKKKKRGGEKTQREEKKERLERPIGGRGGLVTIGTATRPQRCKLLLTKICRSKPVLAGPEIFHRRAAKSNKIKPL